MTTDSSISPAEVAIVTAQPWLGQFMARALGKRARTCTTSRIRDHLLPFETEIKALAAAPFR